MDDLALSQKRKSNGMTASNVKKQVICSGVEGIVDENVVESEW